MEKRWLPEEKNPLRSWLARHPEVTVEALAERVGVSKVKVYALLKGEGWNMTSVTLGRLALATNGSVSSNEVWRVLVELGELTYVEPLAEKENKRALAQKEQQ